MTWNTNGAATSGTPLYSTQLVVEDLDSSGNIKSKVAVDFILKLVDFVGSPPAFTSSCGTTINANAGNSVTVNVSASDPDSGDIVTLSAIGIPSGSSFSSSPGNPASGTLSWTPTASDGGAHLITFTATDSQLHQVTCNITIFVVTNTPPVAQCKNVTVVADAACKASASIDNASFDPEPVIQLR